METEQTAQAIDAPETEAESAKSVPLDEHIKSRQKTKQLEAQLAKFQKQEEERRRAQMSEAEQLKAERDEAQNQIQELQTRVLHNERAAIVRSAALKAKFADPDDAIAFVDLGEIEDKNAAERAVNQIAKRKPHLLAGEDTPSSLQRVLNDGVPSISSSRKAPLTEEELKRQEGALLLEQIERAQARQ